MQKVETIFNCAICGWTSARKSSYVRHLKSKHNIEQTQKQKQQIKKVPHSDILQNLQPEVKQIIEVTPSRASPETPQPADKGDNVEDGNESESSECSPESKPDILEKLREQVKNTPQKQEPPPDKNNNNNK